MRKRYVRNLEAEKQQGPDCSTCIHRKGCEMYAENSFCTRWQSKEPAPEGVDPNKAWERGEQVEF